MIRHASFYDVDRAVEIIRSGHERSENYSGTFKAAKVAGDLALRVFNPLSLFLIGDNGVLVASATESYYGGIKTGNEFFYAEKEGLSFIRAYKRWAKNWGPDTEINMCLSFGGDQGLRARKVLEHEGFKVTGPQMRLQ